MGFTSASAREMGACQHCVQKAEEMENAAEAHVEYLATKAGDVEEAAESKTEQVEDAVEKKGEEIKHYVENVVEASRAAENAADASAVVVIEKVEEAVEAKVEE